MADESKKFLGFIIAGDVDKKKFMSDIEFTKNAYKDTYGVAPMSLFMNYSTSAKIKLVMGIDGDELNGVGGLKPVYDSAVRDDYVLVGN